MFGAGNGFFGRIGGIASEANYGSAMLPDGVPFWAFLIFQTVFFATSATIVSGAMAERTKFSSYCVYSLMISLVVYPIKAATPPTICTAQEPAKSWNPIWLINPPPQIQCPDTGYTTRLIIRL